jgi:hypothetical protein
MEDEDTQTVAVRLTGGPADGLIVEVPVPPPNRYCMNRLGGKFVSPFVYHLARYRTNGAFVYVFGGSKRKESQ